MISCGQEVKLWRQTSKSSKRTAGSTAVRGCVLMMDKGLVYDSGSGSEEELESDEEVCKEPRKGVSDKKVPYDGKSTGFCNCSIM